MNLQETSIKPNIQKCLCKIHGKAVNKFWFDFTFSTEFGSFAHNENISSIYLAFARLELLSFFNAIFKQLYGFNFDCSNSVGGGLIGSGFGSFVMIFLSCESSLKKVSQDFEKELLTYIHPSWTLLELTLSTELMFFTHFEYICSIYLAFAMLE